MKPKILLAALLFAATLACDKPTKPPNDDGPGEVSPHKIDAAKLQELNGKAEFRSSGTYDWCDVFGCVPCPSTGCPPQESIIHCCNEVGICVHVELAGDCDPADYIVICRWGQTNTDGTITCYG